MLFRLCLLICTLALLSSPSHSAVCSIDLGSEWLKVAVVNLKPGQSPISIAINEMSKRKSPALVAFHAGNRLLGEEAAGLLARYPDKVYSQARDALRKTFNHTKRFFDSLYLPFDLIEDSRGSSAFRIGSDESVYSAEELLAMVLGYAIKLAEFHSKVAVKDAVITVPPFFGNAEREGMLAAAQLAGINVLSLVNEYVGAALQYGIDKDFSNESRHVIFYDMGASSTYAALVYFSAYNIKEYGRTVTVNQFQVKDVRWDYGLGGQNMELRMMEYFADEFNNKIGNDADIRKLPKAMAKLRKQVKRTKEILSANNAAPISVESIYDDHDFRSTITREKFEDLCEDLWQRVLVPIKEVLKHSELKIDDISALELIGGATRVPKVQAMLQEFLGRKDLDKHLDADEAIVLGAALHAANISDGIKLNRKFGLIDGSLYGIMLELDAPDIVEKESTKQLLVPRMKKVPSKMFRSIVHSKDFEASLAYNSDDLLPPGVPSPIFARYAVSGLTNVQEKYSSRNLSAPIKANLHFSLSRSGVVSLDRADAVIEVSEWVDVPQKVNITVGNSTADSSRNNTEGSANNIIGDDSNADMPTTGSENNTDVIIEKKLKKRLYRMPLKIIEITEGPAGPCLKEALLEGRLKLEMLDGKDAERKRTAELKNDLEGYVYATKDKIQSSEELMQVLADHDRQAFVKKLDEVQEWLYMDGEDANASEFEKHLNLLKFSGDPIFLRLNELTARPVACQHARTYLSDLQKIVQAWDIEKPWLPKDRILEVLDDFEKLKEWLAQREEVQAKTSGFDTPAFTSSQVYEKVENLRDKVEGINKIPKPTPKVDKTSKDEVPNSSSDPDPSSPTQDTGPSGPSEELAAHDELEKSSAHEEQNADVFHDEL